MCVWVGVRYSNLTHMCQTAGNTLLNDIFYENKANSGGQFFSIILLNNPDHVGCGEQLMSMFLMDY